MERFVETSIQGRVAIITISKPSALNALSSTILKQIEETLDCIEEVSEVKIVIFTGDGRAFVAGADIAEMKTMTPAEAKNYALAGANIFHRIEILDKVTIAAINGFALGGGCELAMACDIRIASDNAMFGQPEVKLGIIPGFSGVRRMMELIGEAKAKEYIFSGRMINADEAERIGLINKVVNPDSLIDECLSFAQGVLNNSFNAIIKSKKMISYLKGNIDPKTETQSAIFAECFNHEDQKEGMSAFLNKEKPVFK